MTDKIAQTIRRAFYDAEKRRPYAQQPELIRAATPPGGDWECVAPDGAITRSIMWAGREVFNVNPCGDLDDETEGQIAMAAASLPVLDCSLRVIMVLAESADNIGLIRELATAAVAHLERDAPKLVEPE